MRKLCITLLAILFLNSCGTFWGSSSQHTVSKGDTLYNISKRYDIPLRDLIDYNNLKPPYTLKIGQTLQIPTTNHHIVAKGDTLYNISKRYNVKTTDLARINDIHAPYTLMIGQRLALSGSATSQTSNAKVTKTAAVQTKKPITTAKQVTTNKPKTSSQTSTYVSSVRKTKFVWPVKGEVISKYGTIGKGRANDGINIKAMRGTSVNAADSGVIAYAGNELKGFGNLILVRHKDGWITAYAHLDRFFVKRGQEVKRGEKIASVGTTGGVNSPQLHFEVRAGKKAVNPLSYLP